MADVKKQHNQANLTLPAVTIGAESNTQIDAGISAADYVIDHEIVVSVRVHTAYSNAPHNQTATVELMDNVITKLKKNLTLGTYRLITFEAPSFREEFEETGTRGGQVNVTYRTIFNYQQE